MRKGSNNLLALLIVSSLVLILGLATVIHLYPSRSALSGNNIARIAILVGWIGFLFYCWRRKAREEKSKEAGDQLPGTHKP